MKLINVAVIGLGYWGPNLVRNFLKIPGVRIVTVCDLLKKNLKKISISFPSVKTTNNYKQIINDKTIDLVAIATPLKTHFLLAKNALLANKHVLIEKPMTQTSKDAGELISIANKMQKIIMVGHTFVYSEAIKKIKRVIDREELGKIYYYDSTRINLGLIQQDTNVIWDLAPHDFSILSYILKEKPLSLRAIGSKFLQKNYEEVAHIIIKYKKNITAYINLSWLSPVKIRTIMIGGNKKMILYNDIEPSEKIRIYDKNVTISPSKITPFSPAYRSGNIVIPYLEQNESLLNQLNHLVDCIRNKKQPISDGIAGLTVVRLLEACDKSLKTNSEVNLTSLY